MFEYDVVVYVDGSFRNNIYSGAFVVCKDEDSNDFLYQDYGVGELDRGLLNMRNVSGEISGVVEAVKYLMKNNLKGLICHDYTGLGHWARKEWKTNNEYTKRYSDLTYPLYKQGLIDFKHVKGHADCKGNIQADELACRAIMEMKKWGEPSPMAINIKKEVDVPLGIVIKKPEDNELKLTMIKKLGEVVNYTDDVDLFNSLIFILEVFQNHSVIDSETMTKAEKVLSDIWGF